MCPRNEEALLSSTLQSTRRLTTSLGTQRGNTYGVKSSHCLDKASRTRPPEVPLALARAQQTQPARSSVIHPAKHMSGDLAESQNFAHQHACIL